VRVGDRFRLCACVFVCARARVRFGDWPERVCVRPGETVRRCRVTESRDATLVRRRHGYLTCARRTSCFLSTVVVGRRFFFYVNIISVCTFSYPSALITPDRAVSLRLYTNGPGRESFSKSPTTTPPGIPLVTRRAPREYLHRQTGNPFAGFF